MAGVLGTRSPEQTRQRRGLRSSCQCGNLSPGLARVVTAAGKVTWTGVGGCAGPWLDSRLASFSRSWWGGTLRAPCRGLGSRPPGQGTLGSPGGGRAAAPAGTWVPTRLSCQGQDGASPPRDTALATASRVQTCLGTVPNLPRCSKATQSACRGAEPGDTWGSEGLLPPSGDPRSSGAARPPSQAVLALGSPPHPGAAHTPGHPCRWARPRLSLCLS